MRSSRELKQRNHLEAAFRLTVEGYCWDGYLAGKTAAKLPEVEMKLPSSPCNIQLGKFWSRTRVSSLHQKKAARPVDNKEAPTQTAQSI